MNTVKYETQLSSVEFIIIVSLMMSLTALAIDAILPGLSILSNDLGVTNPNDRQLVISIIFFGQALGQVFFGPLSDSTGRKVAIYIGYGLFAIGSLTSIFAMNFPMMLLGRTFQGIGVSAPRGVSLALVRDKYEGRKMAQIMSFVMTVFVLVPTIAPSIGQGVLAVSTWRNIFTVTLGFALITVLWFALRVPETLPKENRSPFSLKPIINSIKDILQIRTTLGYTLASGFIYGVFVGYLNSSQQIFQEQYTLGSMFSMVFAVIALSLGAASTLNARLVMRYGMQSLVQWALQIQFGLAVVFIAVLQFWTIYPPLWVLMAFLMLYFFCTGILFGNINTLAMQPLGKKAGVGAGVVGSVSTLISMLLGTMIGRYYNGTVLPLVIGMIVLSMLSIVVMRWAASDKTGM